MNLYKIKPLEWSISQSGVHMAKTFADHYLVVESDHGWHWIQMWSGDHLPCDSLEHGKRLCQEHWESQQGVGKFLEKAA